MGSHFGFQTLRSIIQVRGQDVCSGKKKPIYIPRMERSRACDPATGIGRFFNGPDLYQGYTADQFIRDLQCAGLWIEQMVTLDIWSLKCPIGIVESREIV